MVHERLRSLDTLLQADPPDPPDLTHLLRLNSKRIAGVGSSSVVYCCLHEHGMQVAVKGTVFPSSPSQTEKMEFMLKVRREFGIWRRVNHPNIVPLLGTACGTDFGSDYPCIVSLWMENGTLSDYVKQRGNNLSLSDRILLIKGAVAGLEYLHSQCIVHGNIHPNNIVIDGNNSPRFIDFRLSRTLHPLQGTLAYLYTDSNHAGAMLWAAPELLYPRLYPKLKSEVALQSDIYSLGSVIFFILSGQYPWSDTEMAETKLKKFQNPPRPSWPMNMPDGVWDFIEQCWSPRDPRNRPSAKEVSFFSTDRLEKLLQPDPAADINVVLFGAVRSGKSSIINLLAEKEIAQISSDQRPCTTGPTLYQLSINGRQYRLWDTMGFSLAHEGSASNRLLPYEQAGAVLRSIPNGVSLILLCVHMRTITPSLGRLYWLINRFFYSGRAPIALIVTHFDTPNEEWWERNKHAIAERTNIPTQSIPHACITTDPTGRDQSKHALKELLETYGTALPPVSLRLDFWSHITASSDLATHCRLTSSEATALVEKYRGPVRSFNVIFFGETVTGTSSIVNLIAGHLEVETDPGEVTPARSYRVSAGIQPLRIWDAMDAGEAHISHEVYIQALENACQVVRDLNGKGGVDLLVFVKRFGRLTPAEIDGYRLFEEALCKGQVPVAIFVTHVESQYTMERWWELNGEDLVKTIGGDVVGHACIPPLASYRPGNGAKHDERLAESRMSIEAMLENCILSCKPPKNRISANFFSRKISGRWAALQNKMTVKNLTSRYGLTREQAERLVQSYNGSVI